LGEDGTGGKKAKDAERSRKIGPKREIGKKKKPAQGETATAKY